MTNIKVVSLLCCAVFSFSCITQRRCLDKFPPDTVLVTNTVYRDTVIVVPILGTDTVTVYGTIRDTVYASSGTAHAQTYIIRDTLRLNVWQTDTTLQVKVDSCIREITNRETIIREIKSKNGARIERIVWLVAVMFLIALLFKVFK